MFLVQRMFHSRISESNTVLSNGDSDMSSINIMYKCIFQEVSEQSNSQGPLSILESNNRDLFNLVMYSKV